MARVPINYNKLDLGSSSEDGGSCCHKQNQLAPRAKKRVYGCGKARHRHRDLIPSLYHVDEEFWGLEGVWSIPQELLASDKGL
jgi:hypothetical protein